MRIGITLGDPVGVGPEIVAAALAEVAPAAEVVVFGDRGVLEAAAVAMQVAPPAGIEEVTRLAAWRPGVPSEESGRAQVAYLDAALAEARAGRLDALVTAPIHKGWCAQAGFAFPGHTELLAARLAPDGAPPLPVTMLFAGPRLRVSLATIHLPLAEVPRRLTAAGLVTTIVQTAWSLARDFAVAAPRLGVAGLNPHAGEAGRFGDEEARLVAPAIAEAAQALAGAGWPGRLEGPQVPDAVFRRHLDGELDGVVALYHDQGLIPVKLIDFDEAVNVTLGLPLVRTSPDHGVAYDRAGRGRAGGPRPTSFAAALRLAARLTLARRRP